MGRFGLGFFKSVLFVTALAFAPLANALVSCPAELARHHALSRDREVENVIAATLPHDASVPFPAEPFAHREAVNHFFEEAALADPEVAPEAAALLHQEKLAHVYVVTHQKKGWQKNTADWFHDLAPEHAVRLILASPGFSIAESPYLENATLVELSNGGEFLHPLNADVVDLAGGDFFGCLRNTVFDAIRTALSYASRERVEIVLHSDLIYDGLHPLLWTEEPLSGPLLSEAENYLHNNEFPNERFALVGTSASEAGYHFDFVRMSDRKHVRLTATLRGTK